MDGFRTSDLYFAAFLKTAGVPLLGTERDGRRVVFIFDFPVGDPYGIRDLKHSYFARVPLKIAPLTFAQEVQALKALVYGN